MKIKKQHSLLFLIFIYLTPQVCFAQDGWQNLKWGMGIDEVKEEYPNAITLEKPSIYQNRYGEMKESPIRLPNYRLVEVDFFVNFVFDEDKLAGVILGATENTDMSTKYSRLMNGLTTKYGTPDVSEEKTNPIQIVSNTWLNNNTHIEANLVTMPSINEYAIRLMYWKIDKTELDKF